MFRRVLSLTFVLLGCSPAAPPPANSASPRGEGPQAASSLAPASAPSRSSEPAASLPGAATASASAPRPLTFTFERVQTAPVTSLAVGKPPKIGALAAGEALVFDGSGWARLPSPETRASELSVDIFFGRDDQPRLMGYRRAAGEANGSAFYRRWRGGRFQPEPSELGPLASPGILYGVLGHADPEVVCRPASFCLVKRLSGWGRAPAHAAPARILLSGGSAWALHADRIERLERDGWVELEPARAWSRPLSLFAEPGGSLWIVESERDVVTRSVAGRWETVTSPFPGPRAITGSAANDVWLVGNGGAAHFDGTTWQVVTGVAGPLHLVVYSKPDLWLAGEAGVYRGVPVKPT